MSQKSTRAQQMSSSQKSDKKPVQLSQGFTKKRNIVESIPSSEPRDSELWTVKYAPQQLSTLQIVN